MEEHRPVLLHDTGAFDPKGSGPKLYERLVRRGRFCGMLLLTTRGTAIDDMAGVGLGGGQLG